MTENGTGAEDAAFEIENRQLRARVVALRDELEHQRIAGEDRLSRALATVADENRQLQLTAHTLRDELERLRITGEDRLNRGLATAADENRQLQLTAQALREEIEAHAHCRRRARAATSAGAPRVRDPHRPAA